MPNAFCPQHASAHGALGVITVVTTLLGPMLCAPAPAAASTSEQVVGSHRWLSPALLYAPATSALALAGIAGLALHRFRRRRDDPAESASHQHDGKAPDDDWERRIAMWERRLSARHERDDQQDDTAPETDAPTQQR